MINIPLLLTFNRPHFRVPKTLTFKMRLGAQPFLWKWVLFAWERKMISISKAEHLPSFWNRGPGELANGLFGVKRVPSSPRWHFFNESMLIRVFDRWQGLVSIAHFVQFNIFDLKLALCLNYPSNDYLTHFKPFLACFGWIFTRIHGSG